MIEQIKNILKLYSVKRDLVIYTCLQQKIPLTKENINEVKEILKHKQKVHNLKSNNS